MAPPAPGACMLRRTEGGVIMMEARVRESRLAARQRYIHEDGDSGSSPVYIAAPDCLPLTCTRGTDYMYTCVVWATTMHIVTPLISGIVRPNYMCIGYQWRFNRLATSSPPPPPSPHTDRAPPPPPPHRHNCTYMHTCLLVHAQSA